MLILALAFLATSFMFRRRGYLGAASGGAAILLTIVFGVFGYQIFRVSEREDAGEDVFVLELVLQCASAILSVMVMYVVSCFVKDAEKKENVRKANAPYMTMSIVMFLLAAAEFITNAIYAQEMRASGGATGGTTLATIFLAGLGAKFWRLSKQAKRPSAGEILALDERQPVMYIRSFEADRTKSKPKYTFGSVASSDMIAGATGDAFDDMLSPEIEKEFGPLVGLGDPQDYLPNLGAYKIYKHDDGWQEAVIDLCGRSQFFLVVEGVTPGAVWEISLLKQTQDPTKIFFLTYPKEYRDIISKDWSGRWESFRKIVTSLGFQVPADDPGPGSVIAFDQLYRCQVVARGCRNAKAYSKALRQTLNARSKAQKVEGVS